MKKKILACLLALSVACTSGSVTWAAGGVDEEVEVFSAFGAEEDVPTEDVTVGETMEPGMNEDTGTEDDDVEVFQESGQFETENAQGTEIIGEGDFDVNADEPEEVFSDSEMVFSDSAQAATNVKSAGVLEVGKSITLVGDADGKATFTFKVDEAGIYKLSFSKAVDVAFLNGTKYNFNYNGDTFCATKLNAGSYEVECYDIEDEVIVTSEKMPDIVRLEVVSNSPETFYEGEDIEFDNVKIRIIKENADPEVATLKEGSSYGRIEECEDEYAYYIPYVSEICTPELKYTLKEVRSDNPQMVERNGEDTQIAPSSTGRYYFQIIPSETGEYKISFGINEDQREQFCIALFALNNSNNEVIWNGQWFDCYADNMVVDLKKDIQYIVRAKSPIFTDNLPIKVEQVVSVQSLQLAEGQVLPEKMVNNFTETLPDTKFKIQYSGGASEEISLYENSKYHGRLLYEEREGYITYFLEQDPQKEEPDHFYKGPEVIDYERAEMTELKLGETTTISVSDIYLDGAYFKFQAEEKGNYKFHIKKAGQICTSWDGTYGSGGDTILYDELEKGEYAYFSAKELTANAVEVTVTRNPIIKSIQLKEGKIEGETFVREILENYGWDTIFEDCRFEIVYADGTQSEIVSFKNNGKSKYYGEPYVLGLWDNQGNISVGDRKIWLRFDGSEVTSPKYPIHIVEQPPAAKTTQLTTGQERTLIKGTQDIQWLSFRAPDAGTYQFEIKADGQDITQGNRYFWARESEKTRTSQELIWYDGWSLKAFKLQKGENLFVGVAGQKAAVTAKVMSVLDIKSIELANKGVPSDKYILEFLKVYNYLPHQFKITFSNDEFDTFAIWDDVQKQGVNYGQLQCEWPRDVNGVYTSGELKIYTGNSYKDGVYYSENIQVDSAAKISGLPELKKDKPINYTKEINYNNAFCFVYKAEEAGTYEITFTPKNNNDESNWNNFWILKNGNVTYSEQTGGTSFVREMDENETIYFMYSGEECSVSVDEGKEIKSFSVKSTYSDILYGHPYSFNKWEFKLEFGDDTLPEIVDSIEDSFNGYGAIGYKFDNEQDFDTGETSVEFYLKEFPDIKSDKIPITVKKGSDMNFTKLQLDEEKEVKSATTYANYHSVTFIPVEDGLYEYKVISRYRPDFVDDDGFNAWFMSDGDGIFESVVQGTAGKGYTILIDCLDNEIRDDDFILVTKIDKSKLESLYNTNVDKSSSGYTTSSWKEFTHALEQAEAVLENESALQREIDNAYADLETAINRLTHIYYPPSVDKSSLRKLYDTCTTYKESDYTPTSWKAFQAAMTTAKSALDNSYSQTTINDAEKNLKAAADALVKTADKKALQEAYDKYKSYKKDDYTASTWTPFEKALSDAAKGIEDKDLTTEKAAELLDALEKAAAGLKKVGVPAIKTVNVSGNKATVQLSASVEKAQGYDFVIGTDKDCIRTKKYDGGRKNITALKTDFKYVQKGTYYAYCHAWKKVDGKKVFGGWSEPFKFTVTATTPATPKIKSVSVKGNTVTVVFNKIKNVTSYDTVLGKKTANDSIYGKRPVDYGKLVKKSKSNTVVFKNVKKGTYYVGAHAANRTGKGGKKIFGKWSGARKVVVL